MSNLTVSLIQSNLIWEQAFQNRANFEEKINSITEHTEVIILPEMFTTGFSMNPSKLAEGMQGESIQWMKEIAAKKNIILTGTLIIEENEQFYNRLIWMQPNGQFGYYDKRHLFSYANEQLHFKPGNKRLITQVKGWKINTQICYDLRFPVWSRLNKANEFDILIYVANWPNKRKLAWETLLKARAIENQCYVIGVNRVGIDANEISYSGESCIIDPLGEILYSKSYDEDVYTFTLSKEKLMEIRNHFPFSNDKDDFVIV